MISWSAISHTSSSDIFLIFSAALFCRALIGDTRTGIWERLTARVGVVGWLPKSESLPDATSSNLSPGDWEQRFRGACNCSWVGKIQATGTSASRGWTWAAVVWEVWAGATGSGFWAWGCFFFCLEPAFTVVPLGMSRKDGGRWRDCEDNCRTAGTQIWLTCQSELQIYLYIARICADNRGSIRGSHGSIRWPNGYQNGGWSAVRPDPC